MKMADLLPLKMYSLCLTLLHSERSKLYTILAFMSAIGFTNVYSLCLTVCYSSGFDALRNVIDHKTQKDLGVPRPLLQVMYDLKLLGTIIEYRNFTSVLVKCNLLCQN